MTIVRNGLAALVAFALTGCTANAQPRSAMTGHFLRSLKAEYPGLAMLDASVSGCGRATDVFGEQTVPCSVCVVWVSAVYGRNAMRDGGSVRVQRREGHASFVYRQAAELRNIRVQPGERGMWRWVDGTLQFSGPASRVNLSAAQIRRTGFRPPRGNDAFMQSAAGANQWGASLTPAAVSQFDTDRALSDEVRALVPSC